MTEMIEVIDDDMNVLEIVSRDEIRAENLKHKAALIILKNAEGQIYASQRKKTKLVYPLLWVISAGGMVRPGETYEQGALRELKEELGIDAEVDYVMDFDSHDKYNNYKAKVYLAFYEGDINVDFVECEQGKWLKREELNDYIKKGLLCPDTALFVQKYLDKFEK
ncbi:MAG: NUDIX domain-containing protein [archaeon]